ncbi:hypothetical protein CSC35_0880 [Enterobacter hormaechei]|nr:hypothetical protein CSC35_0880 [Enterobacter hormaechei]
MVSIANKKECRDRFISYAFGYKWITTFCRYLIIRLVK